VVVQSVGTSAGGAAGDHAQPLRILVVTGIYPTAQRPDKGTFVKSQVTALMAAGHHVDVIHPDPSLPTPLRYLGAALRVLGKTVRSRYAVVHGHYSLWCVVARLYWRAPLVCSFLGDDVLGTPSTNGHYSRRSALMRRLAPFLCRISGAVIVKSPQMKQHLSAVDGALVVIPNGVDFDQFHPMPRPGARAALGWHPERYYVLFCADPRIPRKNFPLARRAVDTLRQRGIEADLVVAHGLPQDTIVRYMNASNALVVSSMQEGSPNIVKEAMACNIPVVSTDVGDVREIIGRTDGCAVCPPAAEALAGGLERALRHPGPTTGRDDIRHLDNHVVVPGLVSLYRDVVAAWRDR
jgi:teichuronic acid biosynthesis glycosyltransferase TuaC